ncbi:MAG TPA: hypothetical protein VKB27_09395, partial [Gammaproteobacteria bacterium]|nr:hypothetical protein [Gammaproteobacteria bacterium]
MLCTLLLAACAEKGDRVGSDSASGVGGGGAGGSLQYVAFSRDMGSQLDLFAIAEDGSGSPVTLASDSGDEVFAGWTNDNRVIYVRDTGGGLNDIFSINDDGSGVP